ncbi:hypothetical protein HUU40_19510 [candidate division KSB1 bacterium]|nr:hypothetical protein [candidate division KSB1 bacterium]
MSIERFIRYIRKIRFLKIFYFEKAGMYEKQFSQQRVHDNFGCAFRIHAITPCARLAAMAWPNAQWTRASHSCTQIMARFTAPRVARGDR